MGDPTIHEAGRVFTDPMEGRALYNELLPRSIELAGEPSYMQTHFVGGPKHLPVKYEIE